VGGALLAKEVLQYRFGIDADEFLAKAVEQVDIGYVDAKAVVDHGEVTDALAVKPIDGEHHVCGVKRMNKMGDDAVGLLPPVDLPCFILLINKDV